MTYKILLADDDSDDRTFCKDVLKELRVDEIFLIETENGQQAVDYLEKQPSPDLPDVIILDYNMPFMNGEQALIKIKSESRYSDIPVILYSTSILPIQKTKLTALGAELVCEKPIKFGDYKKMVQSFLDLIKK